eukprot:m.235915 g.235915  ORF g.235915 m.235915 type:complete len:59 (+) comp40130_c0_seq9:214-390(+)
MLLERKIGSLPSNEKPPVSAWYGLGPGGGLQYQLFNDLSLATLQKLKIGVQSLIGPAR